MKRSSHGIPKSLVYEILEGRNNSDALTEKQSKEIKKQKPKNAFKIKKGFKLS